MLYVFDPVAMHNIVVKDQYIYEETAWFVKYVLPHYTAPELSYKMTPTNTGSIDSASAQDCLLL